MYDRLLASSGLCRAYFTLWDTNCKSKQNNSFPPERNLPLLTFRSGKGRTLPPAYLIDWCHWPTSTEERLNILKTFLLSIASGFLRQTTQMRLNDTAITLDKIFVDLRLILEDVQASSSNFALSRAAIKACSSMIAPRAVLTNNVPSFI
jgi:hypothetical protein